MKCLPWVLYVFGLRCYTGNMESLVSIRSCEDYDPSRLISVMERVISDLGGPGLFFSRGERVLLKPNLLISAVPERAIVTHPAFVEAMASLIIDAGAKPFIGDSPSIGNLPRVLAKSGYEPFMKRMGIEAVPFREKAPRECGEGRIFRRIDLAREVFEFDRLINLAKLKTHCQMVLTLAVKNLFGTVIGMDKAAWHLRAGKDYDGFATVLAQIVEEVKPALSLIDGILGMEGNGPSGGTPRHIGIIAASKDAVALDATICRLVGFRVERLRTCVMAASLGMGITALDLIRVLGDELNGFPLSDFKPPKSMTVMWNLSQGNLVRRFLENQMVTRPRIDSDICVLCKECRDHCPPAAISDSDGKMIIDYRKCISCFCCHEVCTTKAIDLVQPRFARFLSRVIK